MPAQRLCFAVLAAAAVVFKVFGVDPVAGADRPNILWITCEDMSPNLGCWGDRYATTPNVDRLAAARPGDGCRLGRACCPTI